MTATIISKKNMPDSMRYYYYYDEFNEMDFTTGTKCPGTMYVAEGLVYFRKGLYAKSIESFNIALKQMPDNVKVLLARSKCYMFLMKYELAMGDVERVLKKEPNSYEAMLQKGEIEYIMGDFEYAYLSFKKGLHLRPAFSAFTIGLLKCRDAISNCIGPSSKLTLTIKDAEDAEKIFNRKKTSSDTARAVTPRMTPQKLSIYDSKVILGKAAIDNEFLNVILGSKGVKAKVPTSDPIADITKKGLEFLSVRQTFWQNIKPLHCREKVKCTIKIPISEYRTKSRKDDIFAKYPVHSKVLKLLSLAAENVSEKSSVEAIRYCEMALDTLEKSSRDALPYEPQLMINCLAMLGKLHNRIGQYEDSMKCHLQISRIAKRENLNAIYSKALKNLYDDYIELKDYPKALKTLDNLWPYAKKDLSQAFIHHEKGHVYCHMGNFEMAKDHADQCLDIAAECENFSWCLRSASLLGQISFLEGNFTTAIDLFEQALEISVLYEDEIAEKEIRNIILELKEITENNSDEST